MRSLVALDEDNFAKLTRVLYRDFPLARGRGKPRKKEDEEKEGKPLRPIGAATEILEFANLPSRTLSDILDALLQGILTLKDARKEAREAKALIRMVGEFEKRFNGIVNPTKSHKKRKPGRWVTYDQVCAKSEAIGRQSAIWTGHFVKQGRKMAAELNQQFDTYVSLGVQVWKLQGKVSISQSIPREFKLYLNDAQKKLKEDAVKWKIVKSLVGTNPCLLLNDRTEALEKYLNVKSVKLGILSISLAFLFLEVVLCVLASAGY